MFTNSRDIKRRLEADGWILKRVKGSHHLFKHLGSDQAISLPHPKKDLPTGIVKSIYKIAGWPND